MFTPRTRTWWLRAAGGIALAVACVLVACQAEIPSGPTAGPSMEQSSSRGVQGAVFAISEVEVKPRLSNQQEIMSIMERLYPRILQDAGIGGTVTMDFVIRADGTADPGSIRVAGTAEREELGQASIAAVRAFKFRPAQRGGEPVNVRIQMPITWAPGTPEGTRTPEEMAKAVEVAARAAGSVGAPSGGADATEGGEMREVILTPDPQSQPDPRTTYDLAALDRLPALVNQAEIAELMERAYPRALQDAGVGGTAVVRLVIEPDGSVEPASVRAAAPDRVTPVRQELLDVSVAVAKQFRFRPGQFRGQNVRVLLQMPMTWQPAG